MKKIVLYLLCCIGFGLSTQAQTTVNLPAYSCENCPPLISGLNCNAANLNPANIYDGLVYNGTVRLPYTHGNGKVYTAGAPIASTGVSGLSLSLRAGNLANGPGELVFDLSGTAATAGAANFLINFGGQSCSVSVTIVDAPPSVASLNCNGVQPNPVDIIEGEAYTGTFRVPYTRGNGKVYAQGAPVLSTGVTGLTAVLRAGSLANNASGELIYDITGTPSGTGTANFQLSFGGQSCSLALTSSAVPVVVDCSSASIAGNLMQHYYLDGGNPVAFEITVANNSSSSRNLTFSTSDLTLSGNPLNGISVSGVSPSSINLGAGQSSTIRYTLSGMTTTAGSGTVSWINGDMSCPNIPVTVRTFSAPGDLFLSLYTERICSNNNVLGLRQGSARGVSLRRSGGPNINLNLQVHVRWSTSPISASTLGTATTIGRLPYSILRDYSNSTTSYANRLYAKVTFPGGQVLYADITSPPASCDPFNPGANYQYSKYRYARDLGPDDPSAPKDDQDRTSPFPN
ncbi:hypothetical protein [Sediminicola luteus]|uniref:Ig-like domain-containing protein n=1 Tax=Sediminicola luteus TaxID=319238 RepID=A0A2A4G3Z0_9FLAO|nr:hypothetical protein [Sediminicola luteus]PCE62694.1 hypothetical protein B7P33_15475 [Sediminicola luteus]